ncbi:hypothetical protein BNATCHR369 (nucleomorph) [Bigelowiella natans]|uniref:Uncharacterized protein n=1 Tax=Bigelowiella natans TaxID=227086 RepID=Q3LVY3_BIGNA|nr:hypothetical protein BNATCHR369 [Bigelowiella natans]ABA27383.1 hypothetical protein [Bigelowiella natans]
MLTGVLFVSLLKNCIVSVNKNKKNKLLKDVYQLFMKTLGPRGIEKIFIHKDDIYIITDFIKLIQFFFHDNITYYILIRKLKNIRYNYYKNAEVILVQSIEIYKFFNVLIRNKRQIEFIRASTKLIIKKSIKRIMNIVSIRFLNSNKNYFINAVLSICRANFNIILLKTQDIVRFFESFFINWTSSSKKDQPLYTMFTQKKSSYSTQLLYIRGLILDRFRLSENALFLINCRAVLTNFDFIDKKDINIRPTTTKNFDETSSTKYLNSLMNFLKHIKSINACVIITQKKINDILTRLLRSYNIIVISKINHRIYKNLIDISNNRNCRKNFFKLNQNKLLLNSFYIENLKHKKIIGTNHLFIKIKTMSNFICFLVIHYNQNAINKFINEISNMLKGFLDINNNQLYLPRLNRLFLILSLILFKRILSRKNTNSYEIDNDYSQLFLKLARIFTETTGRIFLNEFLDIVSTERIFRNTTHFKRFINKSLNIFQDRRYGNVDLLDAKSFSRSIKISFSTAFEMIQLADNFLELTNE